MSEFHKFFGQAGDSEEFLSLFADKRQGAKLTSLGVPEETNNRSKTEEELHEARSIFIEHFYPQLFGDEEMGDPARVFTPSEVTSILVQYEDYLKAADLINVKEGE